VVNASIAAGKYCSRWLRIWLPTCWRACTASWWARAS
jgi:hypothetical protein